MGINIKEVTQSESTIRHLDTMKAAALVLLQLLGLALGGVIGPLESGDSTNIVGGEDAELDEFPFQVSLRTRGGIGKTHFCGGSVINENFVVTAAHCCEHHTPRNMHVVAGGVKLFVAEGMEQRVDVTKIIMHPDYQHLQNDICLLRLAKSLDLETSHVKPVKLPAQLQETAAGTMVTVTGWGSTRPARGNAKGHLQKVDVPIVSDESCRASYSASQIADSMICAGFDQGGKDSCQGDSGGPLVDASSKVLLGVVSWGQGCARPKLPGVYTEVSHFVDWINSVIAAN